MNPIDFILNINEHLALMVQTYGMWIYAILFLIIFAETGLVVTPFLPGDSLLFAAGAIAASTGAIDPWLCGIVVIVAAFCGDNTNYWAGRILGPKVFKFEDSFFFRRAHLLKTEQYYNEYGSRTVIMARFIPIVRTFAPFVAGIGKMPYPRFLVFSSIGSVLWATICLGAGVVFGEMEFVKKHFEVVILAVIGLSVLPIVIETLRKKSRQSSMT